MKRRDILVLFGILLIIFLPLPAQDTGSQEDLVETDRLFVRTTVYPTASLSRYDYNIDIDLYEIRAYVELRDRTPIGDFIDNAHVFVNSQLLDYVDDHYEKRIKISKETPVEDVNLRIETQDGRIVKNSFRIPTWLILLHPRPGIVSSSKELPIKWKYTRFEAPVDVFVYNFRTGKMIFEKRNLHDNEIMLPAGKLPGSTIVRIWVMQSWLYKRYLSDSSIVPGSELVVIPWSQVFFRTE